MNNIKSFSGAADCLQGLNYMTWSITLLRAEIEVAIRGKEFSVLRAETSTQLLKSIKYDTFYVCMLVLCMEVSPYLNTIDI